MAVGSDQTEIADACGRCERTERRLRTERWTESGRRARRRGARLRLQRAASPRRRRQRKLSPAPPPGPRRIARQQRRVRPPRQHRAGPQPWRACSRPPEPGQLGAALRKARGGEALGKRQKGHVEGAGAAESARRRAAAGAKWHACDGLSGIVAALCEPAREVPSAAPSGNAKAA